MGIGKILASSLPERRAWGASTVLGAGPGGRDRMGQVEGRLAKSGERVRDPRFDRIGTAVVERKKHPTKVWTRVLPWGRRSSIYACLVGGMAWGPAAEYASRIATASLRLPPISHRYD